MQSISLKPRIIDVQNISPFHAKVTMEPFERGYGHTLGNALRRMLLSSMPGYAATEVKMAGVLHEYSTIDGVQEDVVDILLNLKGVVLKLHGRDEATLTLKKPGEGVVTAGDIEQMHDVEIVNPDHVIAHLAAGGKLDMQIKVEQGRGYRRRRTSAQRQLEERPQRRQHHARRFVLARCAASATRSIRPASNSAPTSTSSIIDIETNGAIEPEEAVRYAARILVEQLSVFADLKGMPASIEEKQSAADRSGSAAPGRRSRAHRAFGQLPEGREHLLHRRPDPAHRDRVAEDAESRPQVAERDQGSARIARAYARHEARELAAGGTGKVI